MINGNFPFQLTSREGGARKSFFQKKNLTYLKVEKSKKYYFGQCKLVSFQLWFKANLPVAISYAPWINIIPVIISNFCFEVTVEFSNNIKNPSFLFQSQFCSHFLIYSNSFSVNVSISFVEKVWFIPVHCNIKIREPSTFKISFKSFKNNERRLFLDYEICLRKWDWTQR